MTVQQMKKEIKRVYSKWNLDNFDDGKIMAIYFSMKRKGVIK